MVFGLQGMAQEQIIGRVFDASNKQVLAFVSVVNLSEGKGVSSDIDGKFIISASPGDELRLSFVGFEAKKIRVESMVLPDIYLSPLTVRVATAIVENDDNPALRIIREVIDNRGINNPEKGVSFKCKTYNKLVFTAALDSALIAHPERIQELDSSSQDMIAFFSDKHLFLTESVTERSYIPPDRNNEKVIASRVSGLENVDFTLLASQLQSFSFYKTEVSILGINYLSPISPVAPKEYVYTMQDTLLTELDSVFVIEFQPSVKSGAGGLKGLLYINSGDYALRNVIAEPTKEVGGMNIEVRQRYEKIEGKKWFPVQLNSLILFNNVILENAKMLGIGRSYVSEIVLDPDLQKRDLGFATVEVDLRSNQDSILQRFREVEFDAKEKRTYEFIDSLGKAENFSRYTNMLSAFSTGRIPIGKFNMNLNRLLGANDFEGFRLGMGIETNDQFSKWVQFDTYGAYGFKDRLFKGGVGMNIKGDRSKERVLRLEASSDVLERGAHGFFEESFLSPTSAYKLFIRAMDRREQIQASFTTRLPFWLKARAYIAQEFIQTRGAYSFLEEQNENITLQKNEFNVLKAGISFRFAFREQIAVTKNRVISFANKYPVLQVNLERTFAEYGGEIEDWRAQAQLDYSYSFARKGKTSLRFSAAQTFGESPLFRSFNLIATGVNWSLGVPFSFETLAPQSVLASSLITFQFRHRFKNNRPADKTFRPEIALIHNMAWMEYANKDQHVYEHYQDFTKRYREAGLEVHRLIKTGATAFGMGIYSSYNEIKQWSFDKHVLFKISSVFSL